MYRQARVLSIGLLLCTGLVLSSFRNDTRVILADVGTQTLIPPTTEPTIQVSTPEPTAVPPPTISQERSTPIITSVPVPTQPVVQVATSLPTPMPQVRPTATSVSVARVTVTSAPTVAPTPSTHAPITVPLPSPDQLRENARLRWGKHIPAAVRRWAFLIVPAAHQYGLDPNLLAAVMTMESGGDPIAWSGADARGLMQILHGPWDPKENIYIGARMLAEFLSRFHDLKLALAAYNAGPGAVEIYGGVPPYRETRDYVIIVSYLFDLYSHHKITHHRKQEYRSSLQDLQHFSDQREKVKRLAKEGNVTPVETSRCDVYCSSVRPASHVAISDPFWPLGEVPDPLQRVDPLTGSAQ